MALGIILFMFKSFVFFAQSLWIPPLLFKAQNHACGRWAGRVLFPDRLPRGERPRRVAEGKYKHLSNFILFGDVKNACFE